MRAIKNFRPGWLRAVPNLVAQQATSLEQVGLWPRTLVHTMRAPQTIILRLTSHCNYRCQFCHVNELITDADGSDAMTVEEFRQIFSKPSLRGVLRLGITGGEPFLVGHLFELIKEAKKTIPIVTVNTNFSLVKKVLPQINESEIDMLSISLYEPNERLIRDFSTAVKPEIYKRLSFMINEVDNFHSLNRIPEIAEMAAGLGYHSVYFQNYAPYSDQLDNRTPRSENRDANRPVREENEEYKRLKAETQAKLGSHIAIAWPIFARTGQPGERPRCTQPDKQITIDRHGNLAPCCEVDASPRYGNIHTPEGWNSEFFQQCRKGLKVVGAELVDPCRGCSNLYQDPYTA